MSNNKGKVNVAKANETALSPKDSAIFKNMMDLYNLKQYKKSLKIAESLLSKYPKNGEILSFKALILTNTDPSNHDEIMNLAREGLKHDLRSYLCWHVLGVVYKQRQMFKDSIKCFIMALRIDPRNDRLVRDICSLHIEIGDYSTFRKYATIALQFKSTSYRDWLVLAFANHMCGKQSAALKIATEANDIFKDNYNVEAFELSGAMLYVAMLMEQTRMYRECLLFLKDKETVILDNVMRLERLGRAAIFSNDMHSANQTYRQLAHINPGNPRYPLLYLATHEKIVSRNIFQLPGPDVYFTKIGVSDVDVENCVTGNNGDVKDHEEIPGNTLSVSSPVLLSEEILDVDGIYSTSNWCMENMINRIYDKFVNDRRKLAEAMETPNKDEALFLGCYDYAQYIKKVATVFDIRDMPDPKLVEIDTVKDVLAKYLEPYPVARNCVYNLRSKLTPWSRYPLFIRVADITQDDSSTILDVLAELQQDNYLVKSIRLSFTPRNNIMVYHRILEPAIENGVSNVFKYLEHDFTFDSIYCILLLLSRYQDALSKGLKLGQGIGSAQLPKGEIRDIIEHNVVLRNYGLTVSIMKAKIHDYIGEYQKALDILGERIPAFPTSVELYLCMGKIYRHIGEFEKSMNSFCRAYDLDRSDRQTCTKASKALLRAGKLEESRTRWKEFLMEDITKEDKEESGSNKAEKKKQQEAPPEIKSMKYELILADFYMNRYLEGKVHGEEIPHDGSHVESLKKAHDIYAVILERHHEIYRNQVDFHNYCLNRLQYHSYYFFHLLRSNYCTQAYFVKAAEGILHTTLEIYKHGLQHTTQFTRDLEAKHDDLNINYCLDLIYIMNSQKIYHPGIYSAIYDISSLVDIPRMFKAQCLVRAYEATNRNILHPSVYGMVFRAIRNSDYKYFPDVISRLLSEVVIVMDLDERCFFDASKRELHDTEVATLFLEGVAKLLHRYYIADLGHCEKLIHCALELPEGGKGVISIIMEHLYNNRRCSFEECYNHYLYLEGVKRASKGTPSEANIVYLVEIFSKIMGNHFPTMKYNSKV